jgi:hypothetical protein
MALQHDNDESVVHEIPAVAHLAQSTLHDTESGKSGNIPPEMPYSIFTSKEKWVLVGLASCSALFR